MLRQTSLQTIQSCECAIAERLSPISSDETGTSGPETAVCWNEARYTMRRAAGMLKAYWAYDFVCDCSIETILAVFNEAGPWSWEPRESALYGDYLNSRPREGVRVQVHQYPQMGEYGMFIGLRDKGFSALLRVDPECVATQSEVDGIFRNLLQRINVTDMTEIEAYD